MGNLFWPLPKPLKIKASTALSLFHADGSFLAPQFLKWKCVKTGCRLVGAGKESRNQPLWQLESSTNRKMSTHSSKHAGTVISCLFFFYSVSRLLSFAASRDPECSRFWTSYRGELVSTLEHSFYCACRWKTTRGWTEKRAKLKRQMNEKARQKNI